MKLFNRRIKAKSLYNLERKTLNIKGIKATIPTDLFPVEVGVAEIAKDNYPSEISDELKRLDNIQVRIAQAINSKKEGDGKEQMKTRYFDTLIKMLETAQNSKDSGSTAKKKEITNCNDNSIYDFLYSAEYEISNITKSELDDAGLIIWNVALQDRPTIIHKAQIEIIRILQLNNWDLKVIIADCGTDNVQAKIHKFNRELSNHLDKRGIKYDKLELLSDYYLPDENGGNILKKFTEISSKLKISELKEYNTKQDSYSDENRKKVENRITLKFIQPVLSWSVIITEAEKYYSRNSKKTIIIAGKDEIKQWQYIFGFSSNIGGIFNNILEDDSKNTIFQEEQPMTFHSERQAIENLNNGNLARWLFDSFVFTPNYPNKLENLEFCTECKKSPECRECIFLNRNNPHEKLPEFINRKKFVGSFWDILNPN